MENTAFYLTAKEKLERVTEPVKELGENDVLVANKYMGICGSDVYFFVDKGKLIENDSLKLPMLLGHECAGVVEKVGSKVKTIKVGDRVAVEPGIPCGKCEYCKSGRYNLCPDVVFLASEPECGGALCKYLVWPEHMLHKLPDNVSFLEGAMIEPFSIGVHASRLAGVGLGDTVTILGAGCIGLMTMLACRARGCGKIVMIDIFDNRLEKARELGADVVINSSREDAVARVAAETDGGPRFVFECAGNPITINQAFAIVRRGGTVAIVGSCSQETPVKFFPLNKKEVNIVTSFRYANIYPTAIKAVADGRADIKSVVTDLFDFEDAQKGFDEAAHNQQKVVKAAIKF